MKAELKTPKLYRRRNGYFYARLGRGKEVSLKTKDKRQAEKLFRAIREEFLAGRLSELRGESTKTLGEFREDYVELQEEVTTASTFRANLLALDKLIEVAGATCKLDRVTLKHVDEMLAAHKKKGLKTSSINNYIRHMRAILGKAVQWGYVKPNPLRHAKELRVDKEPPKHLSKEDVLRLLSSIKDPDIRNLVTAFALSGRRRGELMSLTWENVDLERGRYYVPKAKNHLARHYPMTEEFRELLESMKAENENPTGRIFKRWTNRDSVSHLVKGCMRKAGLGHFHLHNLRHAFAALFLEGGGRLKSLQGLLGHTDSRTTEIYAHLGEDYLAEEVKRVSLGTTDEPAIPSPAPSPTPSRPKLIPFPGGRNKKARD
ncbi:MAG: tyrosine-type recombinase/integrase [Thermodesulfobacteriota bacterium]